MDRLPRKSTLVKAGVLLTFLVLTFEFCDETDWEPKPKSTMVTYPDLRYTTTEPTVGAPGNTKYDLPTAPDTARLLLPALRQRSLTSRNDKNNSGTPEEILHQFFDSPEDFINPAPKALLYDTGRDMTTEECLYVYGSLVCVHPQPIPKEKAVNRVLEDDFTKNECLELWGHMICDPVFEFLELLHNVIADQEAHPEINPRLESKIHDNPRYIPVYKQTIPEDLLWDDDLDRDMTMQDCLRLWEPVMCEYYFKYVEERGRSDYDCSCDPHFRKRFTHSPSCCHKKMEQAVKPTSHTTRKFEAAKHLEIPRWANNTRIIAAACQPLEHDKFIHMKIDERVHNNCTYQSHVTRTAIDAWLPPHECLGYKPRDSKDFKRCLSVSEEISPEAIVVYIVFAVIGTSLLGLLLLVCVRRRRRSLLPLLQDPNRFKGPQLPKHYAETRSVESGFDGYSRRYDDTIPYHTVGTTLDGANDGWTKWILGKTQNEVSIPLSFPFLFIMIQVTKIHI